MFLGYATKLEGFEQTESHASIFLEYVPGGSIGSCLRTHGAFERPVTISFTIQTLAGMEYLHNSNIIHRVSSHLPPSSVKLFFFVLSLFVM